MTLKITYYAATSSDGFIAREDGDVSWLDDVEIEEDETGLEEFFASVDGLVMGRATYDFVFNYGSWPYEDKPSWVCTSNELQALDGANLSVCQTVDDVIKEAKAENLKHLWFVGGSELGSAFLEKGLITHLSISEMPIKLQSGIRLFARHEVDELAVESLNRTQKKGFAQIDITLRI